MTRPLAVFVQSTARVGGSAVGGLMVVQALRQAGFRVHAIFHELGELVSDYEKRGCTIERLRHGQWLAGGLIFRRIGRWLYDFWSVPRFIWRFRKLKPHLVYINSMTGLAPALAARRLRIPCIWHIRELFSDLRGERYLPFPGGKPAVRRHLLGCATRVVTVSRTVRGNVLGLEADDRAVVLPSAVGEEFFKEARPPQDARARLGLPVDRPIVGVPGTLRPIKGHLFFVRSAKIIQRFIPQVHFAITGDGRRRYRRKIDRAIERARLGDRFTFLGTVRDMPAFYRACDVICIPSESEALGCTAVEAMAVGTPVVARRVGGISEVIRPGKTGFTFNLLYFRKFAEATILLLTRPQVHERIRRTARQFAERHFRPSIFRNRLARLARQTAFPPPSRVNTADRRLKG